MMINEGKVLSQLSGGFDSVAVLCLLLQKTKVKGIFFNYGQKYLEEERKAVKYVDSFFQGNANYLGYEEINVNMQLTRNNDGSPSDYIPVRNVVLGALSANYAVANGFNKIAVGNKTTKVRPGDPYSFADCSYEFYSKMSETITFAAETGDNIEFIMPLLHSPDVAMSKGDVVKAIHDSGLDFNKLWSCYSTGDHPCGECYHCKENKLAFEEAGITDPLIYN